MLHFTLRVTQDRWLIAHLNQKVDFTEFNMFFNTIEQRRELQAVIYKTDAFLPIYAKCKYQVINFIKSYHPKMSFCL